MLCPEVWNFTPPAHNFSFQKGNFKEEETKCTDLIDFHFFNHLVSVVLPDTINVPNTIKDSLNEDCDYYKVEQLNVCELISKEFIEAFVKKGNVTILSSDTQIDTHDCVTVTPSGHLILSLNKEIYQQSGLEGKPSFFCRANAERYDHILTVVGQNCRKLQCLDITASRSVTDRSVNTLLNCKELRELHLYRTSVSVEGYALLLKGLPRLEDLGRCDEFGYILEHLHSTENNVGPFGLRIFQSRDVTTYHLNLLIEMCPHVNHVSIYHDERISDLTVLSALDDLSELKLLSCDFFTDRIKQLLEVKGYNITWLHLEHVEEIDLNALIYISQYCPNLKKLTFYNCEFLEHTSLSLKKLPVQPFRFLERIMCVAECALVHLEFLLSNCFNIKFIQLGSSTGIGDVTMAKVLSKNPMKHLEELKILYSDNLSMKTVQLLMTHCDNLRVLSELESWQGITETELTEFRNDLKRNNIDLDVSPTLSYPSN